MTRVFSVLFVFFGLMAVPAGAQVQDPNGPERVRVFLDCQSRNCNSQEFRTVIDFVDWVRDREASDVHVIMTSQGTGAGTEYVFDFLGVGPLAGSTLALRFSAPATSTQDEVLRGLSRTLAVGLASYSAQVGFAPFLDIRSMDVVQPAAVPVDDPWKLWVFQVGGSLDADGEERENSYEVGLDMSANRTTPEWRIEIELGGEFSERTVELNDGREFVRQQDEWEFETLVVKSLADHWSAGVDLEVNTSTQINRELGARTAAALEWSLFPYEEANRRQFVIQYQLGVTQVRYEEETIFERLEETLADHRLVAAYETRQPWGDISFTAGWTNYLDDWSRYALALRTNFGIRLFRGLQLNAGGGYEIIRNQVYLAAQDLTDEEILVQQRALATGFEYNFRVGLSYRFGSIFNNVVNNRFPWRVRNF